MLPSILIGAAVLSVVALAIRSVVKNRHHCDGDCAACGSGCCSPDNAEAVKKEMLDKIKDTDNRK